MLRLAVPTAGPPELSQAFTRIRDAMLLHPLLVSGEGRFDFDLMSAFPGVCVSKVGAEGLQLIGFRDPPLALAMKLHDGTERALPAICVSLLAQLGLTAAGLPERLAPHVRPVIQNHRKLTTGEIVATLELRRMT
jgi:L-asparaginase